MYSDRAVLFTPNCVTRTRTRPRPAGPAARGARVNHTHPRVLLGLGQDAKPEHCVSLYPLRLAAETRSGHILTS